MCDVGGATGTAASLFYFYRLLSALYVGVVKEIYLALDIT
ncbi:hypothetical protein TCELL_0102 [Thermogladius calderae 1633]|uniref:Uncharacterized protein n=1 Tax=Thermogladius calderae (strain DSM 22663 / VKM B-2946 / 1633) TaxID=1184251 RepID=I3TCN9_THEC1|nr:hypothetical protein TCELL_0102 [Thermogladius calderae 1633]